jgi:high frequency lysogenization protein
MPPDPASPVMGRTLALAGLLQAVKLVQRMAQDGAVEPPGLDASLASVFRLDADSVEGVYGSSALLAPGLQALIAHLEGGSGRDPASSRIAATVLHVERKLARNRSMLQAIGDGVRDVGRQREHFGVLHATVIGRLGDLYVATLSQLSPRVLVQGNPVHLGQPEVVARIRAVLLAAMRSAVLWRQLGGSYWDLLLRRRQMVQAARDWLARSA